MKKTTYKEKKELNLREWWFNVLKWKKNGKTVKPNFKIVKFPK